MPVLLRYGADPSHMRLPTSAEGDSPFHVALDIALYQEKGKGIFRTGPTSTKSLILNELSQT